MHIGYLTERLIQGFGMDLLIHNQANEMAKLGYDVTVYTQVYDGFYKNPLYKVVMIDSPTFVNPLRTEFFLIKRKIKFFRKENIDIWISTMYPFHSLLPFLKGKKLIIEGGTVSSKGMDFKRKLIFWYQRYFNRFFYYPFANRIMPFSKYLVRQIPFFLRFRVRVNYIGADHYTGMYSRNDMRLNDMKTKLGLKESTVNMVYIGRLNPVNQPYKGVSDLVEIFKKSKLQVSNLNLIMAGYGSEDDQSDLESQDIKVIRNASDEDLLLLLDLCDFYVSATKWEGFNLPMIESQSFGKIPVIYDIGPHSELTNSGIDSFVVKSQDEFIEKVVFLSKNPDFRRENAELAKENSKKYSWRKSAINLDKIIRNKK